MKAIGSYIIPFKEYQSLTLVIGFGHLCRNMPASKSARKGIFVIKPDFQSKRLRLLDRIPNTVKPFLRKVFCYKTVSWMNENAPESLFFEILQLPVDLLTGYSIVPYPERNCPERHRRFRKCGFQRLKRITCCLRIFSCA